MKKLIVRGSGIAIIAAILLSRFGLTAQAHSLQNWANLYTKNAANSTNAFAIDYSYHMNGNTANYYWANNTTKNSFAVGLTSGVSMWEGMISLSETASSSAHFKISYDPEESSYEGKCFRNAGDSNRHFRQGQGDAEIVLYEESNDFSTNKKRRLMAHELGHLWGIADLYDVGKRDLDSIYSKDAFDPVTRHDKNAMRIGLDVPWYDNGNDSWKYQYSPGQFTGNVSSSVMPTGWKTIGSYKYYFRTADGDGELKGKMAVGWKYIDGSYRYFGSDGKMVTGWQAIGTPIPGQAAGSSYYYFAPDTGALALGWQSISTPIPGQASGTSYYYFFPGSGKLALGWQWLDVQIPGQASGSSYYYFFPYNGKLALNWQTITPGLDSTLVGTYFFFPYSGKLVGSGWQNINSNRYYFRTANNTPTTGPNGSRCINWQLISNNWYFFRPSANTPTTGVEGSMCINWQLINSQWYFFRPSANTPTSGAEGSMCKGLQTINSYGYYFRTATNVPSTGAEGSMCKGWQNIGGSWYYFRTATNTPTTGPEGGRLVSCTVTISGKSYIFNSSGVCTNY